MKKVMILDGAFGSAVRTLFTDFGFEIVERVQRSHELDAIVFTGGSDIDPSLYGQAQLQSTWSTPRRDAYEKSMYDLHENIPKIGICRGGQFLNVLSGGSMWQDTDGHEGSHWSKTKSGERMWSTSLHHQMMKPGKGGDILMVADESSYVVDDTTLIHKKDKRYDDIEVIFYPETQALCYQGHPEIAASKEKTYFRNLIAEHLKL